MRLIDTEKKKIEALTLLYVVAVTLAVTSYVIAGAALDLSTATLIIGALVIFAIFSFWWVMHLPRNKKH